MRIVLTVVRRCQKIGKHDLRRHDRVGTFKKLHGKFFQKDCRRGKNQRIAHFRHADVFGDFLPDLSFLVIVDEEIEGVNGVHRRVLFRATPKIEVGKRQGAHVVHRARTMKTARARAHVRRLRGDILGKGDRSRKDRSRQKKANAGNEIVLNERNNFFHRFYLLLRFFIPFRTVRALRPVLPLWGVPRAFPWAPFPWAPFPWTPFAVPPARVRILPQARTWS